jgi:acid stress-induced BolA-like protein IbaG/YrbA
LQNILANRLKLKEPRFKIRDFGGMLGGSVISNSFRNRNDLERQSMVRGALEAELGLEGARAVGTILAFTPDEWDMGSEFDLMPDGAATGRSGKSRKTRRTSPVRT